MGLSTDLISQFAKVTTDTTPVQKESTMYGTIVDHEGKNYVRLDGAEVLTPISSTTAISPGDRVRVSIKNHSAVVTGNMTSPSARVTDVDNAMSKITEVEILVADKVDTKELTAQIGRIDTLVSDNVTINKKLTANEADIKDLKADNVEISGKLTANEAEIDTLKSTKIDVEIANAKFATIENLTATNAQINNLQATYGTFVNATVGRLDAAEANIKTLNTEKLSASDIEGKYANIDFSNIGKAAMEYFYAQSGLIEDVTIGDATITGKIVGVTISGDRIEGNTIVAEKLVIKGSDGLYYKLNTDGVTTSTSQTDYNSLNGSVIKAKSITAEKISVTDLVAFGAKIGGFTISNTAVYSGVKTTVDNTTLGIYLGSDGQMAIGDASNYVKYYKDSTGKHVLAIAAGSILLGASSRDVETVIDEVSSDVSENSQNVGDAQSRVATAESIIKELADSISMLVTDENGTSMMKQTSTGWTFDMSQIQQALDKTADDLKNLTDDVSDTNGTVEALQKAVQDLAVFDDYIRIGTYEDEPCIELGELTSEFKVLITNTRIMFMEGSNTPTYISNQTLITEKIEITESFKQGNFVWSVRANGNYGLTWEEG